MPQYSVRIGEVKEIRARIQLRDGSLLQPNFTEWSFSAPRTYVFDKTDNSNITTVTPSPGARAGETETLLCQCKFSNMDNPVETTWNATVDLGVLDVAPPAPAPVPNPLPTDPVGILIDEITANNP